VQREVIAILPEGRDDKVHPMLHKPRDEMDVARQPIEPRDDHRASNGPCLLESRHKSRAQQQGIRSRAGQHVLVPRFDRKAFARTKGFDVGRCAANPRPLRPCSRVLTLKYPIASDIVGPSK